MCSPVIQRTAHHRFILSDFQPLEAIRSIDIHVSRIIKKKKLNNWNLADMFYLFEKKKT